MSDVSTGADATERPESAAEAVSSQGHRTGAESPADSPPRTSNRYVRITAEASDVVELAAAWLVFVTALVAWRLEGLFDRVDVLERLAHPPANRGRCPKCGDRLVAATTTSEGTP